MWPLWWGKLSSDKVKVLVFINNFFLRIKKELNEMFTEREEEEEEMRD